MKLPVRLIRRFDARMLSEWCDITQAAMERHGTEFFKKSPMAFLVDSIDKASKGKRTPPDWWHDLKKAEARKHEMSEDGKKVMEKLRLEVFRNYFPAEAGKNIANDISRPASTSEILSAK